MLNIVLNKQLKEEKVWAVKVINVKCHQKRNKWVVGQSDDDGSMVNVKLARVVAEAEDRLFR